MKLLKAIKKFFLGIFKFLDRKIIVPITKVMLKTNEQFGQSGHSFEGWLSRRNTLLFISLALALLAFIVTDSKILQFSRNSAEVLRSLPVKAVYNEEAYVISGLPESVDITLIGAKTDLFIAKQLTTYDVTVDLTGLTPGQHRIPIKYNQSLPGLTYMVNPSTVNVAIYNKVSQTRKMNVDILNLNSLDNKLVISETKIASDNVTVKGSENQLKQVASVKALLDVKNFSSQAVGTQKVKDVILKAYDQNGDVIDVEIVPDKIEVDVTIASPSRELSVKIIPKGNVAFGKAISSLESSVNKIIVYGSEKVLESLPNINIEVDVTDLKTNKEYKIDIKKPVGVTHLSVNSLTVSVTLGPVTERDIEDVMLVPRNLAPGLVPNANIEDGIVIVNVKGVASVIEQLKAENIVAYVDFSGITSEGTYELDVKIEGDDSRIQYLSKTKKVKIRITKNK